MENNSEHWNALLLSLRELTEWVIRKDTELSSLGVGPVRGDAASLQKQLVSKFQQFLREIAMHEHSGSSLEFILFGLIPLVPLSVTESYLL